MKIINLQGNGQLRIGRTELDVPHVNGITTHILPFVGPEKYQNVMQAISKEGLLRPTTTQTLSLVHLAMQNPDQEQCKNILKRFRGNTFWTSTENLWGKEDVIVYDNVDGQMPSDRESLIRRMKDGDNAIRIVPYGFKTENQSVEDLIKNPYIIAQIGNLPLEVFEEIARYVSKLKPFVSILYRKNRDRRGYTSLEWNLFGGALLVSGGNTSTRGFFEGFASGVAK